jgi:hypothetical protein
MASGTWNTGTWGLNQWGDNANANVQVTSPNDIPWGNGAYGQGDFGGTDENISASIGSVSVTAEINAGWGRLSWGNLAWGDAYSVLLSGISLSTNVGSIVIAANADVNVTGIELTSLTGNEDIFTDVNVNVTGISLSSQTGTATFNKLDATNLVASTAIGSVDISADGNIDVNVTEHTLVSTAGQMTADAGALIDAVGQDLTLGLGDETAFTNINVEVTNSAPLFQFTTEGNAQLSTAQAKFGTASLLLDGTDDYIETTTNLDLSSTDFTIDLWIRPDNVTGYKGIWQSGTSTTEQSYLLGSTVYWTVNPSTIITTSVTVSAGVWTMLSYERQGNTHRIYKNGTLADTVSTGNKQDNGPFSIGKNGFGDFDGYIDEVRVSDIARYSGSSFTEPTSEFEFDSNTNVLIHLDGANGSTDIKSADDTLFAGITAISSVEAIPGIFVDVTGNELTSSISSVTAVADVDVSLTGIGLTSNIGDADAVSVAEVSGIALSANIGSVTVVGNATVSVTGNSLSISQGSVIVTAWAEIDPNVNQTFTEVTTGVNQTWTEVDKAA